jgi:anti-sigma factor RsiW
VNGEHLDDVLLSRLIDGDVSLTRRQAALDHLAGCPACARRHDELIGVAAALRSQPPLGWSAAASARVAATVAGASQRRPARLPAVLAVAAVVASALALIPLALTGVTLSAHLLRAAPLPGPVGALSFGSQLLFVLAIAVLAPAAAYPLARWR